MKICGNCNSEITGFKTAKLCDDNVVCQKCCQDILEEYGVFQKRFIDFQRNLQVINLEEFNMLYHAPGFVTQFDTEEQLLASPFRKEKAKKEFYFLRKKLWRSWVKKRIETTVLVLEDGLDITEVTTTTSSKVKNYFLPIENIQQYKSRIRMAIFPILLMGAVLVFYVFDIWTILLLLLLLWWSYGREILLKTKDGKTYKISINGKTEEIQELFHAIAELQSNGDTNIEGDFQKEKKVVDKKSRFCTACGNSIMGNERFCTQCGQKVD